jgi:hypothetical protein
MFHIFRGLAFASVFNIENQKLFSLGIMQE